MERRLLPVLTFVVSIAAAQPSAHDLERTRVAIAFARDGSFVVDVSNDPGWLKQRLPRFAAAGMQKRSNPDVPALRDLGAVFLDRVVLFVDRHEVRPTSAEFLPAWSEEGLAGYRLRGRVPSDARTLRWYYGLVVDPYPLVILRPDGRILTETIQGDAWSSAVDLSDQFVSPLRAQVSRQLPIAAMIALLALALCARSIASTGGTRLGQR